MPKVSVLMPKYNTKKAYLGATIKRILNQICNNFKFLILNDSSQNKNLDKIFLSYNDKRIDYLMKEKTLALRKLATEFSFLKKIPFVSYRENIKI